MKFKNTFKYQQNFPIQFKICFIKLDALFIDQIL